MRQGVSRASLQRKLNGNKVATVTTSVARYKNNYLEPSFEGPATDFEYNASIGQIILVHKIDAVKINELQEGALIPV